MLPTVNIFINVTISTGSSQCIMKDFSVHLCNCIWPFYSQILYSVICKCPDSGAASEYNLHSHLYMALCKKCLSDLLDLDTHMLALLINNVWLCQFILNSKIVLYFRSKHLWGQIFRLVNMYFIFIFIFIYISLWFILACVFGGCSFWWGRVVIPVDTQKISSYLHILAWRDY